MNDPDGSNARTIRTTFWLPRNAERQSRSRDRKRQQAAEQRESLSVPEIINGPERARREVKVQHHQKGDGGGHSGPEAQDEREAGGELAKRHNARKERRSWNAH